MHLIIMGLIMMLVKGDDFDCSDLLYDLSWMEFSFEVVIIGLILGSLYNIYLFKKKYPSLIMNQKNVILHVIFVIL